MVHTVKINTRRKNCLLRYQSVMTELNKHDCRDVPITVIWRKYIYPKFHISRETLYNIINTDVESELKAINEFESRQLTLF